MRAAIVCGGDFSPVLFGKCGEYDIVIAADSGCAALASMGEAPDEIIGDFDSLEKAFEAAKACKGKPTAIIAKSVKGKGVSFMENNVSWHGAAPNDEQFAAAMAELGGKA